MDEPTLCRRCGQPLTMLGLHSHVTIRACAEAMQHALSERNQRIAQLEAQVGLAIAMKNAMDRYLLSSFKGRHELEGVTNATQAFWKALAATDGDAGKVSE